MKNKNGLISEPGYSEFLKEIKEKIASARIRAYRSLNKELIRLYWEIGKNIVERQEKFGWGKGIVEKLSNDLRKEFSGIEGYSIQNLWYMRQFYLEYRKFSNLQQLVGENPSIGIILCKDRARVEVEYALCGVKKPIGVSKYRLTSKLPKKLRKSFPTPEELKKGLKGGN